MRVILQRVSAAAVFIRGATVGEIGVGFQILVGFTHDDGAEEVAWMADKILGLRLFSNAEGKMNLGLTDVGGGLLVVSQFTLYADARMGHRPSFMNAARPELAIPLYNSFVELLRASGVHVATGEFGANMQVSLVNDGPVTLFLERESRVSGSAIDQ